MPQDVLVTGAAGFIGAHVSRRLADQPETNVIGVDNFDDYYAPSLKRDRLAAVGPTESFEFVELDLCDHDKVAGLFADGRFDRVVHLAARPGVRASSQYPQRTVQSNIDAFLAVLEGCRDTGVGHLVFASSSSVYGRYRGQPLAADRPVSHPVSLYAATKVSNEAMAHSYAHLYDIPTTGLRFFTVYGPWGRPDMAYFLFADRITDGEPIDVYGHGEMERDFTYIDDIVEGIARVADTPPGPDDEWRADAPDPATSHAPYRLFNIGRSQPVGLMPFIEALEEELGREADKNFEPMPDGDVRSTYADVSQLAETVDYRPTTDLREGVGEFVEWYRAYQ